MTKHIISVECRQCRCTLSHITDLTHLDKLKWIVCSLLDFFFHCENQSIRKKTESKLDNLRNVNNHSAFTLCANETKDEEKTPSVDITFINSRKKFTNGILYILDIDSMSPLSGLCQYQRCQNSHEKSNSKLHSFYFFLYRQ